jgi:hypothetical protein
MQQAGHDWFNGLKQHIAECRAKKPLVDRAKLTIEHEMDCRIIGGSLLGWFRRFGPRLLQERAMLTHLNTEWEKDPFIIITSQQAGLVAAKEVLEGGADRVAMLYPREFKEWLTGHPDDEYQWHVHISSQIRPMDDHMLALAQQYPIGEGESCILHEESTTCGKLFARGGVSLWKTDGKDVALLEEALTHWVS